MILEIMQRFLCNYLFYANHSVSISKPSRFVAPVLTLLYDCSFVAHLLTNFLPNELLMLR
jgi:hypothetical protein